MGYKRRKAAETLFIMTMLVFCLCSCGRASGEKREDARMYRIVSGSSSGAYYLQMTPIAALWEQLDFVSSCSVQASSGALENTVLISRNMADIGLIDSFAYFASVNGTEPYTKEYGGFSAIAAGAPSLVTIVVREDSDIFSVSDLAGSSIAVGLAGSGAEFETRFLLESLGLPYSSFKKVDQIGIGPGFTAFQDGKADAVIALMGAGNSSLAETITNVDVRLISFTEDEMKKILEQCQFAVEDVIPAGSYAGVEEDILTVSIPSVLVAGNELPEQEVYKLTEKIYENLEELKDSNTNFNNWSLGAGCVGEIPLHPGAAAFYEEMGLKAD